MAHYKSERISHYSVIALAPCISCDMTQLAMFAIWRSCGELFFCYMIVETTLVFLAAWPESGRAQADDSAGVSDASRAGK